MTTFRFISRAACLSAALAFIGGSAAFAQTALPSSPSSAGTAGPGSQTMGTGAQTMNTMPSMSTGTGAQSAGAMTPSATLNDTDKLFMLRAAQGDMAEISTGQMALKKSKSDQTKQVAQTIIMGHSASLKEGMGLAVLLGLPSPKGPNVVDMIMAQKLSSLSGKDFDKQYLAGQQVDHENTIAIYGMELSQGQDPQVKAFAAKYLPGVEGHTALIYQAALSLGAPDSNLRPTAPPMVTGVAPASMADMNSMPGMSGGMNTGASGMSNGNNGMSGGTSTGTGAAGTGTMGNGGGAGAGSTGTTGSTGAGTDTTGAGTGTTGGTGTATPGQ